MGEQTLDHTMHICIEGPETLSAKTLDTVLDRYKGAKKLDCPCEFCADKLCDVELLLCLYCFN